MWDPLGKLRPQGVLAPFDPVVTTNPPAGGTRPPRDPRVRPDRGGQGGFMNRPFEMDMWDKWLGRMDGFQAPEGALAALQGLAPGATWGQAASALQPFASDFSGQRLPGRMDRLFGF